MKFYKDKQDHASLPQGARQFVCSSNVTVADLCAWIQNGFKKLNTIREIEE
ncbi:hypothetical protein ASZ90_007508 [hydrocarbon metagenome]|uniref:Uncharacterized protein n=1 Tax=hydrocarbon metagenome TaxID=938273 RepID=A0A0W8FP84_9ZZZZ